MTGRRTSPRARLRRTNTQRRLSVRNGNTYPPQKGSTWDCLPDGGRPRYSSGKLPSRRQQKVPCTRGSAARRGRPNPHKRRGGRSGRLNKTARKMVTPAAKSGPLRALRVVKRKRWRDGVQAVATPPSISKKGRQKTDAPPVEAVPQRPTPRQLGHWVGASHVGGR